ncbi:peptidoglycan-binding domain-containing protein [Bacillus suaedaesalsae]|uniref:peptidoglycan-binding domain-containing protein n=1 Tax=Bacillus suaedaesalsae TaxID=2810349 RepID=UPI003D2BD50D
MEAYRNYDESGTTKPIVKGAYVDLPLSIGDQGTFVEEVQRDLIRAGFNLPIYGADGMYGQETRRAVLNFQKKYNLMADGLVGQQTLGKLNEVLSSSKPITEFPLPNGILKQGDRGENVKQLQRALKEINFDPEYIDGIYGPKTEDAVRRFQSMYAELANDGIYGPNTKDFIEMKLAE